MEDEAKAVFNCLATFQNMVEVKPELAEQLVDKTRLLKWLLTRIRQGGQWLPVVLLCAYLPSRLPSCMPPPTCLLVCLHV